MRQNRNSPHTPHGERERRTGQRNCDQPHPGASWVALLSEDEQQNPFDTCPVRCLDRTHAAAYLGIGKTLLTRIGPPPIRLGRRRVYDRVDLDRWLDNHKSRGRAIKEELWPEKKDSTGDKIHRTGGSKRSSRTDAEYVKALGLKS